MTRTRVWLLALVLTLTAAVIRADDAKLVDNPEYHGWDGAPIGTKVNTVGTTKVNDTMHKTRASKTLVERSAESLTFDVLVLSDDPSGQETPQKDRRVVPAKVPLERLNVPAGIVGKAVIVGQETITAGGGEFKCDIVKIEGTIGELDSQATVRITQWLSNDLIGRTVRFEAFVEQDGETLTSTAEFVSIEMGDESKPN